MAKEIERKFLLKDDSWRSKTQGPGKLYSQGYLCSEPERTVRVRLAGERGVMTVKGLTRGATRTEFEYALPAEDARQMLDELCERPLISKYRHFIHRGEFTWEIDEFLEENQGLVVAEIELEDENQKFDRPAWLGREVTDDPRYYNSNLSLIPFKDWRVRDEAFGR